ncbi:hypothetical protein [Mesorhizobium sp. CN2-181]|uniref:hypothetical protein n=1 Tax=Mesorhizobium yinganensis TaxID=3157707 RepID=UPI0032B788B6
MAKLLLLIGEMGVFAAIFAALAFVSWTKMTLGAVLTFVGAFFPNLKQGNEGESRATIKLLGAEISFSGVVKFGVIVGGVILIIGSVVEGASTYFDQANAADDSAIKLT